MINLLSDDLKDEIRASRVNTILVWYTFILLLAIGFIFGVMYTSRNVLQVTKENAEVQIAANDTKASVYSATKDQVQALSSQLEAARTALNQQVHYSRLLTDLAQLMPEGTLLDSLQLSPALFSSTPVQIKVYAKKSSDATALQEKFKASPLFSSFKIDSTAETGGPADYPVVSTMTVVFNQAGIQ